MVNPKNWIIALPEKYDFDRTIRLIQRGFNDPINQIHNNCFIRTYWVNNQYSLLKIKAFPKQKIIKIYLLNGTMSKKEMEAAITNTLGLDDPLLLNINYKIPYKNKLTKHWGISAIGYPCYFEALVHIILGQQVSVPVANIMRLKFTKTFGEHINCDNKKFYTFPRPESMINQPLKNLRQLGISGVKSIAIVSLAREFVMNNLVTDIKTASNIDSIRERLLSIHGIGQWTINWFLLRALRKFDIVASTDIAVRKAFTWYTNKKALMTSEEIDQYIKKLGPFAGSLTYVSVC